MPRSADEGFSALDEILSRSPDLLKSVLEGSPDTISISDVRQPDLPLTYVNPSFQRTTGYRAEEVLGRNCRFLQGEETKSEDIAKIRTAIENRQPVDVVLLNYKKSGEPFINSLRMAPVFDKAGDLSAYLGIQRDITQERLRAERQMSENRLETLGTATGSLAHQLNNLLHPVTSLLSLHLEDISDMQIRGDLEVALYSANQAADLSNRLLGLSRGDFRTGSEVTPIPDGLLRTVELARLMLPSTNKVETHIGNVPKNLSIPMNETLFAQVLINIITNASQATKQSGLIRIELDMSGNAKLQISIADDGPGIPLTERKKVFSPFYSKSVSKNGTGLGLFLVFQIINEIGGNISIGDGLIQPDGVGLGCMITLDLPFYT